MALKMHSQQMAGSSRVVARRTVPFNSSVSRNSAVAVRAAAQTHTDNLGFELMRDGVKKAAADSILTPRFYTTGMLLTVLQLRFGSSKRCHGNALADG